MSNCIDLFYREIGVLNLHGCKIKLLLMNVKQENVMYVTHSNKKSNTDRYNIEMKICKILSLNKINNILYLKCTKVQ